MLIVIVIIGILASALIPRLSSARGRANDVARKADLAQTAAALVSYQIDRGAFPGSPNCSNWCSLNSISGNLISAGMSSIPTDPNTTRAFSGISTISVSNGQYGYTPISKWWISNNGFVIMAGSETEGWSNRVVAGLMPVISSSQTYEVISSKLCKSFTTTSCTAGTNTNGECCYDKNSDQLRYIYLY